MSTILLRSARVRTWARVSLLAILAVSIGWGLVIFVWSLANHTGPDSRPAVPSPTPAHSEPTASPAPSPTEDTVEAQDQLAARPMLSVPLSAATPQPLAAATRPRRTMRVPAPTDPAAGLPVGFPRTPAGAVAQLAAIDAAVFANISPSGVAAVYDAAALPGAPALEQWSPSVAATAILRGLNAPDGTPQLTSSWTLTHAQVKGVLNGGTFVVACVLGELDGSYRGVLSRVAIADCQRMVWQAGRWRIGPGQQPAWPPATWPGSADCRRAGWVEVSRA